MSEADCIYYASRLSTEVSIPREENGKSRRSTYHTKANNVGATAFRIMNDFFGKTFCNWTMAYLVLWYFSPAQHIGFIFTHIFLRILVARHIVDN